jgi:hypothetical protein
MDWAAWGPTIVSVITCIFFAGVLWSRQNDHSKRLDDNSREHEEMRKDLTDVQIDLGMLKAWKDGYAAARAVYDRGTGHIIPGAG